MHLRVNNLGPDAATYSVMTKRTVITVAEMEAILSAIYTQIECLKAASKTRTQLAGIRSEIKTLRAAERKLRRSLKQHGRLP